ncbi:hypothetical protein BD770DRAFT_407382 [Pilaira anomala]|nr:hypothetical protein BD770DRAFT_407382 [Pilaira anomala]
MYPSLTPVASSSRWYSKKQTAQEKLAEITQMEDKLIEKRLKNLQVGATILIRGKPALESREDRVDSDDEHIVDTHDTSNELFGSQPDEHMPHSPDFAHYDSYSPDS